MSQPTLNRAMRRKLKKKGIKPPQPSSPLPTSLAELLQAHPEYIKFELDEQKIQELESQEQYQSLPSEPLSPEPVAKELMSESGDDSHA